MTVTAHFDGKAFVPDEPVDLPEGTRVEISFAAKPTRQPLAGFIKLAEECPIKDSPPDWSEQHDHYIHGTPKR